MKKSRTYLVVADETAEFNNALRYAIRAAKANNVHMGVLYVMPESGFQNWGLLEDRIREDRRKEAEALLQDVAQKVKEASGLVPTVYVGEGDSTDAVIKTIKENPEITNLFLGGSSKAGGPGPLVAYFSGKGINKLPVPMTIIPDHILLED